MTETETETLAVAQCDGACGVVCQEAQVLDKGPGFKCSLKWGKKWTKRMKKKRRKKEKR